MTRRKGEAVSHLFLKEEPRVKAGRQENGGEQDESTRQNGTDGWLGRLRLGESRWEGDLEVVALLRDDDSPPDILLTKQAVEAGLLEIVERSGGVVQELLARNGGEAPVAILAGDMLVGCKQNRVVAHSVIVAPGTSLAIPVGCMEHGRWHHETARFAVGDTKMAPQLRSRTQRDVRASFEARGERRLDQQRLWRDVDATLAACRTLSPTSDYYEIVKREGGDARERASRLAAAPGQVGALVLADGALVGLEATGHHRLWSAMAEATLSSYFVGLRRGTSARAPVRASAGEWLARVQSARVRTTTGLGLGTDLDVEGPGFAGVGLGLGPLCVHVAVFPA